MSNVSIRNLCVSLGGNRIIENLDLDVIESEFLVLLGPSGCGKSTLLHSIAGLIDVADGSIAIGGEDMTWADPADRRIGMVFQSYALYPTMSVEGNMSFGLRIGGTPKAEIERRVKRAAEILHLEPLLKRKPSQLSGGQRQRVAIGRALVREADVLLFDEPLSNLDAKLRAELRRELKLLHRKLRSTMIYVTHDQVEAMTLATRIVVMQGGKIQQIGTPESVYSKPDNLFVAGFLGAPGMNFLNGTLACDRSMVRFAAGQVDLDVSNYAFKHEPRHDMTVVLGIRPEQIQIGDQGNLTGVVSLVEPMGNHEIVWIDYCGHSLAAIVQEMREFKADDRVRFSVDAAKISIFDQFDEARL
ncbi:MAG: ABC transporter ATP-binding protein [Proteobacteria bacterium]|nr:ABC transporter ATP-binding protein [Pseudomonadota bacterium]